MARVSKRRHPHLEPHSPLGRLMEEHLEWLLINNYSEDTADHARWAIASAVPGASSPRWALSAFSLHSSAAPRSRLVSSRSEDTSAI